MAKDFNEVWHELCRKDSEISIGYQYETKAYTKQLAPNLFWFGACCYCFFFFGIILFPDKMLHFYQGGIVQKHAASFAPKALKIPREPRLI